MRAGALRRPGLVTGLFCIGYGVARIVSEFFREPDPKLEKLAQGLTMGMVLSAPLVLFGMALIAYVLHTLIAYVLHVGRAHRADIGLTTPPLGRHVGRAADATPRSSQNKARRDEAAQQSTRPSLAPFWCFALVSQPNDEA